jgi:hypothetical protein
MTTRGEESVEGGGYNCDLNDVGDGTITILDVGNFKCAVMKSRERISCARPKLGCVEGNIVSSLRGI